MNEKTHEKKYNKISLMINQQGYEDVLFFLQKNINKQLNQLIICDEKRIDRLNHTANATLDLQMFLYILVKKQKQRVVTVLIYAEKWIYKDYIIDRNNEYFEINFISHVEEFQGFELALNYIDKIIKSQNS